MADDMVKFLEEGRSFLEKGEAILRKVEQSHEQLKVAQELANEKQKSADKRISLIQWMIVLILAPIMVSTTINSVDITKKLDKDEAYDLFPTKTKVIFLQNHIFEINESFYAIRESTYIQKAEERYNSALREFNGDTSRSAD